MLPKQNRFNIRKNFLNLKKTGKMINSESFGFLYIVGIDTHRFNFIVSTKISKKAVERNLIRRRLSEITRELLLDKNISGVFLAKKVIIGKTYKDIRNEVKIINDKIS